MKIGIFVDGVIKVVDNYATRLSKVADVTVFLSEEFGRKL